MFKKGDIIKVIRPSNTFEIKVGWKAIVLSDVGPYAVSIKWLDGTDKDRKMILSNYFFVLSEKE